MAGTAAPLMAPGQLAHYLPRKSFSGARERCDDAGAIHASNARIVTIADVNVAARVDSHRSGAARVTSAGPPSRR
jgi:hypothetical protein